MSTDFLHDDVLVKKEIIKLDCHETTVYLFISNLKFLTDQFYQILF